MLEFVPWIIMWQKYCNGTWNLRAELYTQSPKRWHFVLRQAHKETLLHVISVPFQQNQHTRELISAQKMSHKHKISAQKMSHKHKISAQKMSHKHKISAQKMSHKHKNKDLSHLR